jgi:CelD/BcsL family acetyltransferase involved in cellulose biosynthesis
MAWFDEMVSLHVESWRARGEEGAFPPEGQRFHSALVRRSFGASDEAFRASLLRIRFGQETIGVLYFLEHHGRVNFYQSGLSYADDSKLKPGLVAHTLAIRHYTERGSLEYDFLGGEAETARYKRSLSTDSRDLVWRDLPSPAPKMGLLRALRLGRRWLRSRGSG